MALLSKVNITAKVYILSTIKLKKCQAVRPLLNISAIFLKYPTFDKDLGFFFHIFMVKRNTKLEFLYITIN